MMKLQTTLFWAAALGAIACSNSNQSAESPEQTTGQVGAAQGSRPEAVVDLKPTEGNSVSGYLTLSSESSGVRLRGKVTGLGRDTVHGFHVHEKGDCSAADATSAGGHFNPTHEKHGHPGSDEHHLGDMTNLRTDAQGTAQVDMLIEGATLGTGKQSDVMNKAVIVHASKDDYQSQPSGDSGPRMACGVIKKP